MNIKRTNYATTLNPKLIKNIKMLAVEQDKKVNELLEEAIQDLLKKYNKK
jgi:ribosomal protein L13